MIFAIKTVPFIDSDQEGRDDVGKLQKEKILKETFSLFRVKMSPKNDRMLTLK